MQVGQLRQDYLNEKERIVKVRGLHRYLRCERHGG